MDAALKTVAYLRVSTRSQDLANQKLAILEFSQKRRFPIDQFIESRISSRHSPLERRIDEMLGTLDRLDYRPQPAAAVGNVVAVDAMRLRTVIFSVAGDPPLVTESHRRGKGF